MNFLSSAAAALSAAVLVWLSALPASPPSASPTAYAARDDEVLSRVEREVTGRLREKAADRWRFSRVHRPTPAFRTTPDAGRSDRRHAAFRILTSEPYGGAESVLWLVRVDRVGGAIELAPAGSDGAPRWQPLDRVLPPRLASLAND